VKLYFSFNGTRVEAGKKEGKDLFLSWLSALENRHRRVFLSQDPSLIKEVWGEKRTGVYLYQSSGPQSDWRSSPLANYLAKAVLPPIVVFFFRRLIPEEEWKITYLQRLALIEAFSIALEKKTPLPRAGAVFKEARFFQLAGLPEYGLAEVNGAFVPLFGVTQDQVARLSPLVDEEERREALAQLLKAGTGLPIKVWRGFLRGKTPAPSLEGPSRPWAKGPEEVLEVEKRASGMFTLNQAIQSKDLEVLQTLLTWRTPLRIDLYQRPERLVEKAIKQGWAPGLIALLRAGYPITNKEVEKMGPEVLLDLARALQEDPKLIPLEVRSAVIKKALSLLRLS